MHIRKFTVNAARGAALVALTVTVALLAMREPIVKVNVSFAGYTNDSRNNPLASFRIVNEGTRSIFRLGMYHVDSEQHPFVSLNATNFFGLSPFRGRVLAPGQSETFAIPVVSNQGAWRVVLRFENYRWRRRIRDQNRGVRMNMPRWRWELDRWLAVTNHLVRSEWVENAKRGAQRTAPPNDGPAMFEADSGALVEGRHR